MSSDLEKCEVEALKLSVRERAILAEHLIASLDPRDDTGDERLWLEEADRRYREYKKGKISARPAEDVLRDARTLTE